MTRSLVCFALISAGCSDYDLVRPNDAEGTEPETTPTRPEEVGPDIVVFPESIDFGSWPTDCAAEPVPVTIENVGTADLIVSDIQLSGDGASAFFHDGLAQTIGPDETIEFDVHWTPAGFLSYAVDLRVDSNDPDEAQVLVPTLGVGAEDGMYEESFDQDYNELVDVLWVIDNSCSMFEEIEEVSDNFEAFITGFVDLDLDYHLGVITTDMIDADDSGKLQGPVITPASANPVAEFLAQTNQGAKGSTEEVGFDAVHAALTEPLLSGANAGFLRDDAALSIIVLSDEDDTSSMNSTTFVNWLQGLKADPELVRFNSIVGDRTYGCTEWVNYSLLAAGPGDSYIDATEATDGFFMSICTSNYSLALENISYASAGMETGWELTEQPSNVGGMTVLVDGEEIPQDSSNGWTYNATDNEVTFHDDAVPEAGSTVSVSYPVALECPQ